MAVIKSFFEKGLFHIMGSTLVNKIIGFITNIIIVRILTKTDYGIFSSAFNTYAMVALFSGFGITNGILYFCSDKERKEKRLAYYDFSLKYGFISDIFLALILITYGLWGPVGISDSRRYIVLLCALPLASYMQNYFATVLRTRKENIKYSRLLNINSFSYAVFAVIGSYIWGIYGTIAGRYLAFLLTTGVGVLYCKPYFNLSKLSYYLTKDEKFSIIKYSAAGGAISALNNILYMIDVWLIGFLVADTEILASYKVATVIPEHMTFIPSCIAIVIFPMFVEQSGNSEWLLKNIKKLYKSMLAISGIITLLMFIASPMVVNILWGEQYADAIPCFRILSISFFFLSSFRILTTNILAALGRVKFNLIVSIIVGISNIVLDIVLIYYLGSIGAAIATLMISILASALSVPYLVKFLVFMKRKMI